MRAFYLFLITLTACKTVNSDSNLIIDLPSSLLYRVALRTPVIYSREDPDCILEAAPRSLGLTSVNVEKDNKSYELEMNMSDISGQGLKNSYVSGVYYGYHAIEEYQGCESLKKSCTSFGCSHILRCKTLQKKIIDLGQLMPICKRDYSQDSLENAALAAVASVYKTGWSFDSLIQEVSSQPVNIYVHPKLERRFILSSGEVLSSYKTDNEFWAKVGGVYSVHFLPQSQENKTIFSQHPMWENLGIGGHEMGHHLSYLVVNNWFHSFHAQIMEEAADELSLTMDVDFSGEKRSISGKTALQALNEGWADLFSYLTFETDPFNFLTALSFGKSYLTRRPDLATVDGFKKQKSLDEETLKHFFKPVVKGPKESFFPDDQDIHVIGAKYIWGVLQVLMLHVGSTRSNQKINEIKQDFVRYLRSLNKISIKGSTANQVLKDSVNVLIDHVASGKKIKKDICDVLATAYPVYWMDLQSKYSCI